MRYMYYDKGEHGVVEVILFRGEKEREREKKRRENLPKTPFEKKKKRSEEEGSTNSSFFLS